MFGLCSSRFSQSPTFLFPVQRSWNLSGALALPSSDVTPEVDSETAAAAQCRQKLEPMNTDSHITEDRPTSSLRSEYSGGSDVDIMTSRPSSPASGDEDGEKPNQNRVDVSNMTSSTATSPSKELKFGIDRILIKNNSVQDNPPTDAVSCTKPLLNPSLGTAATTLGSRDLQQSTAADHHWATAFLTSTYGSASALSVHPTYRPALPRHSSSALPPLDSLRHLNPSLTRLRDCRVVHPTFTVHHGDAHSDISSTGLSVFGSGHSSAGVSARLSQTSPPHHSSLASCRKKRSWSRAVFSNLQRKGLEKRFEVQKYVTKPDRRQLAAMLGLTDAQVKVWFQNRRMKWRHQEEAKNTAGGKDDETRFVACSTSADIRRDVISDVVVSDDNPSDDRSIGNGNVAAAVGSNGRKPASIMSVADILDLRVASDAPANRDVISGQNGADPRRL